MIQEIELKGISNSPSDHECADGELGSCLNLINEDGALKPIYSTAGDTSLKLDETITSGYNAGVYKRTIRFVHKVTHGDEIHIHYIAYVYAEGLKGKKDKGYLWQWYEPTTGEWQNIGIADKDFNSVNAIGNILCFVGDDNLLYAMLEDDHYVNFNKDTFNYTFSLKGKEEGLTIGPWAEFEDLDGMYKESATQMTVTVTGIQKIVNGVDAIVNKDLEEKGREYFKYKTFGVIAVRLYDGSLINISNVFILNERLERTIDFSIFAKRARIWTQLYKSSINISCNFGDADELVDGIDVYLTQGRDFLNTNKTYTFDENEAAIDQERYKFKIDRLSGEDLYREIDKSIFLRSIFIGKESFNKEIPLKRPLGTEESISLSQFERTNFGGYVSFVYNNRLHIADIVQGVTKWLDYLPTYTYFNINSDNTYPDNFDDKGNFLGFSTVRYCKMAIVKIKGDKDYYFKGKIQYPLPPFMSFDINYATSCTFYIVVFNKYYKKEIRLHQSTMHGFSYYVHTGASDNSQFEWLQIHKVKPTSAGTYDRTDNGEWEEITSLEWYMQNILYEEQYVNKRSSNLIRVSEAENPLVFPAANSVQVGSSVVKSLASNTHTISEGQFGTAPLYAFTDEGVWALITTGEGTYEARQPVSRDIVSNPDGIISTDDAVLYPTKRGIMLIQGTSSECITEALRGNPFRFTDLFRKDFAKKVLDINGIPDTAVDPIDFDKFLENANMTFDYKDQRLILYNNEVDYAYVFSFKSKMWGAMECDFKYNVNVYPDSYVVTKDGNIKNIHNDEPTEDTRYLVCTRPLVFGSPEHFKTMLTTIVRGYFRNKPGKCGIVLYASNDLFNWMPIATSVDKYLRGIAGSPYKYFRVALTGSLSVEESISGFSSDIQERWQNKLR
nr:hypothetical protein WMHIBSEC_WMHIBSEC_CDS_0064 [Caudoviricetes sp.]CAI9751812.1 hypothetical protein AZFZUZMX_AZFZUZMX_CDS_0064 [Caudoviricetes sp.]